VCPGGCCAAFTGGACSLAAGAWIGFWCVFGVVAGPHAFSADGVGTDQFGHPAPSTGEHQAGSLTGLTTSTSLTLKSSTPANGSRSEERRVGKSGGTGGNTGTATKYGGGVTTDRC